MGYVVGGFTAILTPGDVTGATYFSSAEQEWRGGGAQATGYPSKI